jgi:hypothetical protein
MSAIPGFDVRSFECELPTVAGQRVTGSVTHLSRDGWAAKSEQYLVEVRINARLFKFPIIRGDEVWITQLVQMFDSNGTLTGIHTFPNENEKIEFLFEECLIKLVGAYMNVKEQDEADSI